MVIYREFKELKGVSSPVHWAMGMFDGLHLGHAGVIAAAVEGAARDGGIAAVLTFRTHPLARVRPESVPPAIMAVDAEKFALMEELGVKMVLTLEFSSRLASMSPEEFIRELCASCRVAEIAVGEDWHFGRGRAGDVETLRLLSGRYGFRVTAVPPILRDGERVSSTRIREAVRAADFLQAAGMLGRDQSGKGYIALDFFNIFWLFTIASVGGLIMETIYHMALYNGELQDRAGLLWGPFSPIYGCGAVLVTVCLNRLWKANPFLIFCASAVIGGAFEYCTSWFMEVAFGITAWDYTGRWLSIDGRTSGQFMFFWGLIGVVWVKWLLPRLLALINRIPWKVRYSLTAVCTVLMVIDIAFTLMALDCWYGRMAGQPQDSPVAMWFSERYSDAYMANRFQTMHIDPSKAGRM